MPQPTSTMTSNEPTPHTRRNIMLKGTSAVRRSRSAGVRRSLLVCVLACSAVVSACGGTTDGANLAPRDSTTTVSPPTTTSTTSVLQSTTTSAAPAATTVQPATTTTSTAQTATTVQPTTTTSVLPATTTPRSNGTPRLVVSQTTGLDPAGTRVVVRGTGFDVSKGIYVIVCNQAAWTASRRCVGGVNLDGSSPVSEWVSSNPPAYAKGLTVPFAVDGSFSVTLLARAIGDEIDCTKEPCGVVSFADHTRRDDRSQDVFVPVSFNGN